MCQTLAKTVHLAIVMLGVAGLWSATPPEVHGQPANKKLELAIVDEQKIEINRHLACIALSPDAKMLAVGEDNVHLYDVSGLEPKKIATLETRVFTCIRNMVFSPDNKKLAMGGADHILRIYDVEANPPVELHKVKEHSGVIGAIGFSPDGKTLVTGSEDQTIIVWDLTGNKPVEKALIKLEDRLKSGVRTVEISPGGKMLSAGCHNGTLRVWDITGAAPKQVTAFQVPKSNNMRVTYSKDGRTLAMTVDNNISLYTGKEAGRLNAHTEHVTGLAYSPDGKALVSVGRDGRLILWDLWTHKPAITKEKTGSFTDVAVTLAAPGAKPEDGLTVAVSTEGGVVHLFRVTPKDP